MDNLFIKKFWNNQAITFEDSHWASWGDNFMIDLEINFISNYINESNFVLDVGCSNGYSAFQQLEKKSGLIMKAVDFAENMIETAILSQKSKIPAIKERIEFFVGDVCNLKFPNNTFDVAYTTRVLINLPNWEIQKKGIDELVRVVKPGGKVLILEAFWEPLCLLNAMRGLVKLPPLVEHDFNRYLKFNKIESYLMDKSLTFERFDYSSLYYLGSRFLRELVTDYNQFEGYSNPINEIFHSIQKQYFGGGFGIQQAYVIVKS